MHTTTGGHWLVGISNIDNEVPKGFALYQNYPNPFNPSTVVRFQMSVGGNVSLKVYDVQ